MRASGTNPDRTEKRLTLRSVQDACSWKSFELGKEYLRQHRVANLNLRRDGILTGTIRWNGIVEVSEIFAGTAWEYMTERPEEERHVEVSLRTGQRHCSCPYSRVGVCSHVAAVLICAIKDLRVTVPSGGRPVRPGSGKRTILPYRERADQILAQATSTESAAEDLEEIVELADACHHEGDLAEMVMVILGASESLLSGLDYRAYSHHIRSTLDAELGPALPSGPEPKGMDAVRVSKFNEMLEKLYLMLSRKRMLPEQKMPCIAAAHRLYAMTNPWGPSRFYRNILRSVARQEADWDFWRRLHDPLVPENTPDPKKDPDGFKAVMKLAQMQWKLYSDLKDDSLFASYERCYRNDPGTCARYIQYLRHNGRQDKADAVEAEGKRLFPDANIWDLRWNYGDVVWGTA